MFFLFELYQKFLPKKFIGVLLLSFLLASLASLSAIALVGFAAWFLSATAIAGLTLATAGQFNYLLPSAFVRLLAYVRIAARYAERLYQHDLTLRMIGFLRSYLYRHWIRLSPLQLRFSRYDDLHHRFIYDLGILDNTFIRILTPFCVTVFTVGFFLYIAAHFSATLFYLLLVFSCLFIVLSNVIFFYWNRSITENLFHLERRVCCNLIQLAEAAMDLKIWGSLGVQKQACFHWIKRYLAVEESVNLRLARSKAFMYFVLHVFIWVLVYLTIQGISLLSSAPYLAFFLFALIAFFDILQQMPVSVFLLPRTQQAYQQIFYPLSLESAAPRLQESEKVLSSPVGLTDKLATGLTVQALKLATNDGQPLSLPEINFSLALGKQLCITGPSGIGKSSLLYTIAGFLAPYAGEIFWQGKALNSLKIEKRLSHICFIEQFSHIFNTSIRQNLTLSADFTMKDSLLWDALSRVALADKFRLLPDGLDTILGEQDRALSGGEKKRLALARAYLKPAPLLLLDEPTEGLDQQTEIDILENLYEDFKEKTVLLVSHKPVVREVFASALCLNL